MKRRFAFFACICTLCLLCCTACKEKAPTEPTQTPEVQVPNVPADTQAPNYGDDEVGKILNQVPNVPPDTQAPNYGDDELGKILNQVAKDGYWFKDGKKPALIENTGYKVIMYKPYTDENGKVWHFREGSAPLQIDGVQGKEWPVLWLHDDSDNLREGIEVALTCLKEGRLEENTMHHEEWRSFLEQPVNVNGIEVKDSYNYQELSAILVEDKERVIVIGYNWQDKTINYMFKLK